jgi:hypothetical protein
MIAPDPLESSRQQHGLLTYALVQEGLQLRQADFDPKNGEKSGGHLGLPV